VIKILFLTALLGGAIYVVLLFKSYLVNSFLGKSVILLGNSGESLLDWSVGNQITKQEFINSLGNKIKIITSVESRSIDIWISVLNDNNFILLDQYLQSLTTANIRDAVGNLGPDIASAASNPAVISTSTQIGNWAGLF